MVGGGYFFNCSFNMLIFSGFASLLLSFISSSCLPVSFLVLLLFVCLLVVAADFVVVVVVAADDDENDDVVVVTKAGVLFTVES